MLLLDIKICNKSCYVDRTSIACSGRRLNFLTGGTEKDRKSGGGVNFVCHYRVRQNIIKQGEIDVKVYGFNLFI